MDCEKCIRDFPDPLKEEPVVGKGGVDAGRCAAAVRLTAIKNNRLVNEVPPSTCYRPNRFMGSIRRPGGGSVNGGRQGFFGSKTRIACVISSGARWGTRGCKGVILSADERVQAKFFKMKITRRGSRACLALG